MFTGTDGFFTTHGVVACVGVTIFVKVAASVGRRFVAVKVSDDAALAGGIGYATSGRRRSEARVTWIVLAANGRHVGAVWRVEPFVSCAQSDGTGGFTSRCEHVVCSRARHTAVIFVSVRVAGPLAISVRVDAVSITFKRAQSGFTRVESAA